MVRARAVHGPDPEASLHGDRRGAHDAGPAAAIIRRPREYDLSSIEEIICGGAPLPVELAQAFMRRYPCRIREVYGLTEATGLGTANRRSEPFRPGSAGRAYANTELAIFDDDDQPLPARRARRDLHSRADRHAGLPQSPRRDRPRSCAAAGCTPATSATWTTTAICTSSIARRT